MHRLMARDRDVAVAALFAAEAGSFGRYGFGHAVAERDLTIRRSRSCPGPRRFSDRFRVRD
jgi:hypothetical protein